MATDPKDNKKMGIFFIILVLLTLGGGWYWMKKKKEKEKEDAEKALEENEIVETPTEPYSFQRWLNKTKADGTVKAVWDLASFKANVDALATELKNTTDDSQNAAWRDSVINQQATGKFSTITLDQAFELEAAYFFGGKYYVPTYKPDFFPTAKLR